MDVCVEVGKNIFNFRVAAVIKNKDRILLHHAIDKNHVTLPGGRVMSGEDTITAIKREILEEIGQDTKYVKSRAYIENFFEMNGKDYHEILVVHELEFKNKEMYEKETIEAVEPNKINKLEFLWCNTKDLKDREFLPQSLANVLQNENEDFVHKINDERKK